MQEAVLRMGRVIARAAFGIAAILAAGFMAGCTERTAVVSSSSGSSARLSDGSVLLPDGSVVAPAAAEFLASYEGSVARFAIVSADTGPGGLPVFGVRVSLGAGPSRELVVPDMTDIASISVFEQSETTMVTIVGAHGRGTTGGSHIFVSKDAGSSWIRVTGEVQAPVAQAVPVGDVVVGWEAGGDGHLFASADGGASFTQIGGPVGPLVSSGGRVYTMANRSLTSTADGRTWQPAGEPFDGAVGRVAVSGDRAVLAGVNRVRVVRLDGSEATTLHESQPSANDAAVVGDVGIVGRRVVVETFSHGCEIDRSTGKRPCPMRRMLMSSSDDGATWQEWAP